MTPLLGRYWKVKNRGVATPYKKRYIFQMEGVSLVAVIIGIGVVYFILIAEKKSKEKEYKNSMYQPKSDSNGKLLWIAIVVILVIIGLSQIKTP